MLRFSKRLNSLESGKETVKIQSYSNHLLFMSTTSVSICFRQCILPAVMLSLLCTVWSWRSRCHEALSANAGQLITSFKPWTSEQCQEFPFLFQLILFLDHLRINTVSGVYVLRYLMVHMLCIKLVKSSLSKDTLHLSRLSKRFFNLSKRLLNSRWKIPLDIFHCSVVPTHWLAYAL